MKKNSETLSMEFIIAFLLFIALGYFLDFVDSW